MTFSTNLSYSTFISAKKILSDSGLFILKPDKSIQDGRETVGWMIRNLHGSRIKEFWEQIDSASQEPGSQKQEPNSSNTEMDAAPKEMRALYKASISDKTQSEQAFCERSRTVQEHLTNSSFEFVRCNSDTLTENSREEETAHAPLGVALPQTVEGVSEKEKDLPVAMDCTTLALVDAVQGESALLLAENQDCGEEVRDCSESTFSAASPAQIEKSSTEALFTAVRGASRREGIADQKIEPSRPSAELMTENSVSCDEVKAVHEGKSSAAPVPNSEKWSHEAIVARSNMRPERMQKLKVAANSGQNPGFDFLHECWSDDPALQIVIKKLLAKFPQWRVACVDGMLVNTGNSSTIADFEGSTPNEDWR
ncbi:hypothetical protein [Komarekiella delphini-convector]|uniref:hypothetical protein n=1 Tax=Komarekiella delphini-convector TaxID=3050158 RepID=UPI001785CD2A|nr:hypothetical protein [Komarekiella delphini-convector]